MVQIGSRGGRAGPGFIGSVGGRIQPVISMAMPGTSAGAASSPSLTLTRTRPRAGSAPSPVSIEIALPSSTDRSLWNTPRSKEGTPTSGLMGASVTTAVRRTSPRCRPASS